MDSSQMVSTHSACVPCGDVLVLFIQKVVQRSGCSACDLLGPWPQFSQLARTPNHMGTPLNERDWELDHDCWHGRRNLEYTRLQKYLVCLYRGHDITWRSEVTFQEPVLSFRCVVPRDWTLVVGLGSGQFTAEPLQQRRTAVVGRVYQHLPNKCRHLHHRAHSSGSHARSRYSFSPFLEKTIILAFVLLFLWLSL